MTTNCCPRLASPRRRPVIPRWAVSKVHQPRVSLFTNNNKAEGIQTSFDLCRSHILHTRIVHTRIPQLRKNLRMDMATVRNQDQSLQV